MNAAIEIYKDKSSLADAITDDLINDLQSHVGNFGIALAGGSTPRIIYEKWATIQDKSIWNNVHFFWGDERCVPPDDDESNYKMAYDSFLSKINIFENQIHRIQGETNPNIEVQRYAQEIKVHLSIVSNFPQFDWILLGIGADGHTASIFSNSQAVKEQNSICIVAKNPQTQQKRISLTLPVINNAKKVTFLVTGEEKAEIALKILRDRNNLLNFPAAQVNPQFGTLQWYLDEAAASKL